jgi:hypothetical protein
MDKQAKKEANATLFFVAAAVTIYLLYDWAYRCRFLDAATMGLTKIFFQTLKPYLFYFRLAFVGSMILIGYVNMKTQFEKKPNKPLLFLLAGLSIACLLAGYIGYLWYNVIAYPLVLLSTAIFTIKSVQLYNSKKPEDQVLDTVATAEITDMRFSFNTDKGQLVVSNAEHGIWIEAGPGGGKTVLIENILYQAIKKDFAMFVYDFEGNPYETDETQGKEGTILSRTVYTTLKLLSKDTKLRFAFMNFNDMSRTVKPNPFSPKYLTSKLDIIEAVNTLMKNLEKEWVTKTDFWAKYAINLVTGGLLYLHKHQPKFCTVPHLVQLILSDIDPLLKLLSQDKELENYILPILTAYRQESSNQLAGVITTSQLPLTQIYIPEIFYVLNPKAEEEFDLDITKKENPYCFCVGNNGMKQNAALGPVLAVIATIVSKNMNQFNRHKAMYAVDEGDTIFIPNIDTMPATIRKKGVITLFAIQTFNQTIDRYGDLGAKKLRDNLNNQFLGKTNNADSAERMVKMFGEYKKTEFSTSQGDSGESQTASIRNERYLQIPDIGLQETGHFTGYVSNGKPPRFHAQFEYFSMEKMTIPRFSLPVNSGNLSNDLKVLDTLVQKNFEQIQRDIDLILEPFRQIEPTID